MKKKTLCALALWLALPMLLFGCGDTANTPTAPSESISISADIEPRETISAPVEESAPITAPQETPILIEPDPIVEEHTEESAEPNMYQVNAYNIKIHIDSNIVVPSRTMCELKIKQAYK